MLVCALLSRGSTNGLPMRCLGYRGRGKVRRQGLITNRFRAGFDSRGFTLIELLVAAALIGILAAIAVMEFGAYRRRSFDASANSDLHNAALAQEALFATNGAYVNCRNANCEQRLPGFHRSKNVTIRLRRAALSFTGTSTHANGSGKVWAYDGTAGGIQ